MPKPIVPHKHPSGRPQHTSEKRGWSFQRVPQVGPVTPGLKRDGRIGAVGFTSGVEPDQMDWWGGAQKVRS